MIIGEQNEELGKRSNARRQGAYDGAVHAVRTARRKRQSRQSSGRFPHSSDFKIAVLSSTKGTDLQAIIDEMKTGKMPGISLTAVISNKQNCGALEKARANDVPAIFIDPANKTREEFDLTMAEILQKKEVDLIVLVGYMRILSPEFVRKFPHRIINIHPSLIPKYSGKNFFNKGVHEAVLKAGEKETGMTIHYVDENVDTGTIICQKTCPVSPNDTPETLKDKVQALEKKYYPEIIRQIAQAHDRR